MGLILLGAANLGASVILVAGPTHLTVSHSLVQVMSVSRKCTSMSSVFR
jgi:phosphopantothenoylcysteine decarboxylase/phosphopantothenate--cysteine ligase